MSIVLRMKENINWHTRASTFVSPCLSLRSRGRRPRDITKGWSYIRQTLSGFCSRRGCNLTLDINVTAVTSRPITRQSVFSPLWATFHQFLHLKTGRNKAEGRRGRCAEASPSRVAHNRKKTFFPPHGWSFHVSDKGNAEGRWVQI